MSLINKKWLQTNDGKLFHTDDLTEFRVEQAKYNKEICATNKCTGKRVYIDWLPEEYNHVNTPLYTFIDMKLIKDLMASASQSKVVN